MRDMPPAQERRKFRPRPPVCCFPSTASSGPRHASFQMARPFLALGSAPHVGGRSFFLASYCAVRGRARHKRGHFRENLGLNQMVSMAAARIMFPFWACAQVLFCVYCFIVSVSTVSTVGIAILGSVNATARACSTKQSPPSHTQVGYLHAVSRRHRPLVHG